MRIQVIAFALALVACQELVDGRFEALTYIDAVSPERVPAMGGTEVTITGRNFQLDAVVLLNGVEVTSTVEDATRITFVSPPGAPGPKSLTVAAPEGATVDSIIRYAATDLFFGPRGPALSVAARGAGSADLNQDGRGDVVAFGNQGISTFLNRDRGTRFDAAQDFPGSIIVNVVDVDNDGQGDLIESKGIRFASADGFGPLEATSLVAEDMAIHHLTAGDFDGDGVYDVAFVEGPPKRLGEAAIGELVVARGASGERGNFTRAPTTAIRSVAPRLTATDLDRDRVDDLLIVDETRSLQVIYAPLVGSPPPAAFNVLTRALPLPPRFVLADTNGDGFDDLVFAGEDSEGVERSLWSAGKGLRDGPFNRPQPFDPPVQLERFCGGPRLPDQLEYWKTVGTATFLLANCGDELRVVTDAFGGLEPGPRLAVGDQFVVVAAELDGRGDSDVLITTGSGVRTYFGGRTTDHAPMLLAHHGVCLDGDCEGGVAWAAGRFSEDDRFALVQGERLAIFGDIDDIEDLVPVVERLPGPEGGQVTDIESGDLDGDGDDDLVVVYLDRPDQKKASVTFVMNDGGTWRALPAFNPDGTREPLNLRHTRYLWDLNGDGAVELIWRNLATNLVWSITSTGVAWNRLDDDGEGIFTAGMKQLDLDLDGTPDLYGLDGAGARAVELRLSRPDGFKRLSIPLTSTEPGQDPSLFDRLYSTLIEHRDDGALDIWVSGPKANTEVVLHRYRFDLATGALELLRVISLPLYAFDIHRAEIDGDGTPDLVLAPNTAFDRADLLTPTRGLVAVLPGAAPEDAEIVVVDFARSSVSGQNAINWRSVSFFDVDDDGLDDLIYANDAHAYEPVILKNQSR